MKRPFGTYNPADTEHEQHRDSGLGFLVKPFYFILLIWVVFWLDQRFMLDLYRFGIFPRHIEGLLGVFTTPLLHGSLAHLTNNSLPILALGAGLYYFYPKIATKVIIISWVSSGLAVWLIGRESFHIGASGVIYALAGFIFLSGLLRRQPNLLALSLLVVFLYGGMVWGLFPIEETVSWEAHLTGAFSGFALAVNYRRFGPPKKKYSWDFEEEEDNEVVLPEYREEPKLQPPSPWQHYSNEHFRINYHYRPNQHSGNIDNRNPSDETNS